MFKNSLKPLRARTTEGSGREKKPMRQKNQVIENKIRSAASAIKQARPAYEPIIDFYLELFLAQEKTKETIDIILPDLPSLDSRDRDTSLIKQSDFPVDYDSASVLLKSLCDLTQKTAPKLASSAVELKQAVKNDALDLSKLFDALINDDNSLMNKTEKKLGIPGPDLLFFVYSSIAPSIYKCASELKQYQPNQWSKPYCPICGNLSDLAFFDEDGSRHLICGFCRNEWKYQRIGCIYCGTKDAEKLYYFINEEEKEYRVDMCDLCRKYLKVIDLREIARDFYPRLEQVSTIHLDMKAKEMGYEGGIGDKL